MSGPVGRQMTSVQRNLLKRRPIVAGEEPVLDTRIVQLVTPS